MGYVQLSQGGGCNFFLFLFFQIFPTSAIEICSAQMFADVEQLPVLTAFCLSVAYKQITEGRLLNFPSVFESFQRKGKFMFLNTGFRNVNVVLNTG